MNTLVIFGGSDRTSSPNNLKHWSEWKERVAKDNKSLTDLFISPSGHAVITVLVLLEMFFPPGSSDPRDVADVLCTAGSPGRGLTRCMRSEENLHQEQKHGALMLGHGAAWMAKPFA